MPCLTEEQKKAYVEAQYHRCPYCQSDLIGFDDEAEVSGNKAILEVECDACGAKWYDRYTLTDIEEIEPPIAERDPTEPDEGDWVTEDFNTFWQHTEGSRRVTLTIPEGERWQHAIQQQMTKDNFWPNVWQLSDHGNLTLLTINEEES